MAVSFNELADAEVEDTALASVLLEPFKLAEAGRLGREELLPLLLAVDDTLAEAAEEKWIGEVSELRGGFCEEDDDGTG